MDILKIIWDKMDYRFVCNTIGIILILYCSFLFHGMQEMRIKDMQIKHNYEMYHMKATYEKKIELLENQLKTGYKNTPTGSKDG